MKNKPYEITRFQLFLLVLIMATWGYNLFIAPPKTVWLKPTDPLQDAIRKLDTGQPLSDSEKKTVNDLFKR